MADTELPIDSTAPFYTVGTTIENVQFLFDVRWNDRDQAWYFDLLDETGDPIVSGLKIVLGVLLGRRCRDPRFPSGAIFASDLSNSNREATLTDLGVRVKLYYRPAADMVAA